ncbi:hypothetical protein K474DRAFT_1706248 [Panus rudis PR-1116 ss-1]|nr:hypothetical protein K474DRAFT_1706248 [Panus rudis PR-1116 ss-1]
MSSSISVTGSSSGPSQTPILGEGSTGGPNNDTNSGGGGGGNGGNIFTSSGGPPLILVFLAAGLLIGSLFALIVLRRLYPQRTGAAGRGGGLILPSQVTRRSKKKFGKKPKLWDVYLDVDESVNDKDVESDSRKRPMRSLIDVLPLSMKFIADQKEGAATDDTVASRESQNILQRLLHDQAWGGLFTASRVPPTSGPSSNPEAKDDTPIEGKLQLAVTIAMPLPPSLRHPSDNNDSDDYSHPPLDYTLGLIEVPCPDDVKPLIDVDVRAVRDNDSGGDT